MDLQQIDDMAARVANARFNAGIGAQMTRDDIFRAELDRCTEALRFTADLMSVAAIKRRPVDRLMFDVTPGLDRAIAAVIALEDIGRMCGATGWPDRTHVDK